MIKRFKEWLKRREAEYDFCEKARLCKPCDTFCGKELCRKVGCLNMEMRTNATRLQLLINRLEDAGYVFATKKPNKPLNVIDLNEYRKRNDI